MTMHSEAVPRRRGKFLPRFISITLSLVLLRPDLAVGPVAAEHLKKLSGIKVGADTVELRTDGPVQYNAFVIQNPPRLVVELLNTQYEFGRKLLEGRGKYLKRVRSGQYQSKPSKISRVVLDLSRLVAYRVRSSPGGLKVLLSDPAGGLAPALVGQRRDAPAQKPLPGGLKDGMIRPEPETPAPGAPKALIREEIPKTIPTKVVVGRKTKPVKPAPLRKSVRDIIAELPTGKLDIDFDGARVRDVLNILGAKAGVNVIYGPEVSGTLTMHLKQVPFDEAFKTIIRMQGLVTQQVGDNILRIMTPGVLKAERAVAVKFTKVFPIRYTKVDDLKTQLDAVRAARGERGVSVASPGTNVLVVTDTPEGLVDVERLIAKLDRRPLQVLIECKLVEVSLHKNLDLGIQWSYERQKWRDIGGRTGGQYIGMGSKSNKLEWADKMGTKVEERAFPMSVLQGGTGVNLPADNIFGAFRFGRITDKDFLDVTISAAATRGKAKVLSDPKVATLNNQQATINITTQIPYLTSSVDQGVVTQAITYVTVGITLTVTPTVHADGMVTLKLAPNVSQPAVLPAGVGGTTAAPTIDTRTANTTVLVRDGETIVIGGLIHDSMNNQIAKVPLLGDIPLLGWLFKKKVSRRQRQELLVFVTPRVLPEES